MNKFEYKKRYDPDLGMYVKKHVHSGEMHGGALTDIFELFCVNKIALCQHEAQEILPWSDEWMVCFCLEPMN